ncbi:MAG TPA: hypothetical protein VK509_06105 [Polyangiales bacterium]|nr:hypothetical protein [Polyangiales bacterium]
MSHQLLKSVASVLFIASTLATTTAFAETIPARNGGSLTGAEAGCFNDEDLGLKQTCSGSKWWSVALRFSSGGFKQIAVWGSAGIGNCVLVQISALGVQAAQQLVPINAGLQSHNIVTGDFVKLECLMPQNTRLFGVDYFP